MEQLVGLILAFIIVYIVYLILIVFNKKGRTKLRFGLESTFLLKVYKVKINKISDKKLANIIALSNSLIVSLTFYIIGFFFKKTIFQILLAFPILILLIIIIYSMIGRYYKRKYDRLV